jgi:hypothetical protein
MRPAEAVPTDAALAARFVAPINRRVVEGQPVMKVDNEILADAAWWL